MKIAGIELKSAEVLEGEAAFERISEAVQKEQTRVGQHLAHTTVKRGDDGITVVGKRSGSSILVPSAKEVKLAEKQMDFNAVAGQASELQRIASERGIQWESALGQRAIPYWASDQRPDAHGDIVLQNWLFNEFEDNHPLANSHDWGGFPIGSVIAWQVVQRSTAKYMGPALQLLSLFALKEQYETADTAFRLVRSGFLVGGSVGFSSDKVIDIKDEDERQKLGLGRWGFVLDENHLLEFSPTLLGANAGAFAILSRAKSRGLLLAKDMAVVRDLEREAIIESKDLDKWNEVDSKYVQMARMLFPEEEWKRHEDVEEPINDDRPDPLKNYVPGGLKATKAEDDEEEEEEEEEETTESKVLEALADISSMLESGLLGISTAMGDMRDLMEQMTANSKSTKEDDDEEVDDDEEEEEDEDEETESDSKMVSLLRGLEELNNNIKALHEGKDS